MLVSLRVPARMQVVSCQPETIRGAPQVELL